MQLTEHFSLVEFTASAKAEALRIDNTLPADLLASAVKTCEMLERIRSFLSDKAGKPTPIRINSGYRCVALNDALGSKRTSDHIKARAVDWVAPGFGAPYLVAKALVGSLNELGIGQLIHERTWLHTSTVMPAKLVNRVITITDGRVRVGIQE